MLFAVGLSTSQPFPTSSSLASSRHERFVLSPPHQPGTLTNNKIPFSTMCATSLFGFRYLQDDCQKREILRLYDTRVYLVLFERFLCPFIIRNPIGAGRAFWL